MANALRFVKMQGVGNDFVVVDGVEYPGRDWARLAVEVCRRHTGIGGDGLLVVDNSDSADVLMRMFNPDGTPDVCGNGMRCVARYVAEKRKTKNEKRKLQSAFHNHSGTPIPNTQRPNDRTTLTMETLAGIRVARMVGDSGEVWAVDMGEPRFRAEEVPILVDSERIVDFPVEVLGERIPITSLSTGTTHSVILVDELPADDRFLPLSAALEHHPLFPERTSVLWAREADSGTLELRIWERGAGETWGCGTGACAAAVASIIRGVARSPVTVRSKGGSLTVGWRAGESMLLTGPAEFVYEGTWPLT